MKNKKTKCILILILCLISSKYAIAGGTAKVISPVSFVEQNNKYVLQYKKRASNELYTINLSYDASHYSIYAKHLTQEEFDKSVNLLKQQLNTQEEVLLGFFASAPCTVDKNKNVYRGDTLRIYEHSYEKGKPSVVYIFCKYR